MSNGQANTERPIASAPSKAPSGGDCVLQSSDGVRFKTYRYTLIAASSVFDDMFNLPQPSEPSESDTLLDPIILTEDSQTVQALLATFHPVEVPDLTDLNLVIKLANAYEKYLIPTAKLCIFMRELYKSSDLLSENALTMYALAWRLGMEPEAKVASRYTHTVKLADDDVIVGGFGVYGVVRGSS